MNSPNEQFSLIYNQYIEKIYRFVYIKVSSVEVAQDITSRVFTKGWVSYQKNREIKNVGAFLYQIARNEVIDHYRDQGKKKVVSSDVLPEVIDTKQSFYDKAVISSDIEGVRLAMNGLKQEYQDVLILHYLEDMHPDQIAEVLGKPAGTVRVMIHRGLKDLKDKLVQES